MNNFNSLLLLLLLSSFSVLAQDKQTETYPKLAGFVGLAHPVITFSKEGTVVNFTDHYIVAIPSGIHIWKTPKVGFSLEITPILKVKNNINRMDNLLIHPGILVALGNGFNFAGRVAFETSGRYGFTPIVNKTLIKIKGSNFYTALPAAFRFGNNEASSLTLGVMFGLGF